MLQAAETPIVAVRVQFGSPGREVHPRQDLADAILVAQNVLICEERELAGLCVVGGAAPWEFLVLDVEDLSAFHQLRPV